VAEVKKLPIRIYVLAKKLKLPTKKLVGVGRKLGFELNGLSMLDPAQHVAIEKAVMDRPPEEPPPRPT